MNRVLKEQGRRVLRNAKNILLVVVTLLIFSTCISQISPGWAGCRINQITGSGETVLSSGYCLSIPFVHAMYSWPLFKKTYAWTRASTVESPGDESIWFQTRDGMSVNADIGATLRVDPSKVESVLRTYRQGMWEIVHVYVRNDVRDSLNANACEYTAEEIYGTKKNEFLSKTFEKCKSNLEGTGIILENIYIVNSLRLPEAFTKNINEKVAAIQRAEQKENELREAQAEAQKMIATTEGSARSRMIEAKSRAEANRIIGASLSPEILRLEWIKKWDGILPRVHGGEPNLLITSSLN